MRITVENVSKRYASPAEGSPPVAVLESIRFSIESGQSVALLGPSGSGKSTLLSLIAGLDSPDQGRVLWGDLDLTQLTEEKRAKARAERIGFIFQSYHLIPTLTALENILLPLEFLGLEASPERAYEWLKRLGLSERAHHFPRQLSGGEQQRVAIARALIHNPAILLADEPTGNLDTKNGDAVTQLLFNERGPRTLVIVTHDPAVAARADRVLTIRDGRLQESSTSP